MPRLPEDKIFGLTKRLGEKALNQRAQSCGLFLDRCGKKVDFPAGLILYHAAARLRANEFNYISLESALSDAGVISQIPMNWVTLMSSGRCYTVNCGSFGHIEFVHTKKKLDKIVSQIEYDPICRLWRASVSLALRDMALTRRDTDLINWEIANEFI